MRAVHGPWSLTQVAASAGVPRRIARLCVERGWLPSPTGDGAAELQWRDVLVLRVAAALLDAPLPYTGVTRAQHQPVAEARDEQALAAVRALLADPAPSPEAMLVITAAHVTLARSPLLAAVAISEAEDGERSGAMGGTGGGAVLVLPVGSWLRAVRRELGMDRPAGQADTEQPGNPGEHGQRRAAS